MEKDVRAQLVRMHTWRRPALPAAGGALWVESQAFPIPREPTVSGIR